VIDLAEIEGLLERALAAVREARAERENAQAPAAEELSGEPRVELMEAEMAPLLGLSEDALYRRRKRGECEGFYRRAGRSILYDVAATLAAWRGSLDSDM